MRKKRFIHGLAIIMLFVLTLTACAGKSSNMKMKDMKMDVSDQSRPQSESTSYSYDKAVDGETESAQAEEAIVPGASTVSADMTNRQIQDKIIKRVSMVVETQDFDGLITAITDKIRFLGGYEESSSINGRRYYYSKETREGRIVARIPKDHLDEFTSSIDQEANVVNSEMTSENVTLQYVDMESRKKALEIEQERLFVLLEKEEKMDNIVTLERRLSDIRYELQNYESQLRTMDNQVEYSTVTLTIYEVERITPGSEEKKSVGKRIENGFRDTMYRISEGAKDFVVWFVVNLPYLIIWGGIFTAVILLIRRYHNKKKLKMIAANPAASEEPKQ